MHPIDYGIVALYLVGCTALGARIGGKAAGTGLRGYFVGESNIPAWAVTISIVATETSAATFLSVPGIAYKGDMAFLQLAFGYILARIIVALVLLPAYFKREILTAYQLLERRFGGATQKAASVLFLVSRTFASALRLLLAAKVLQVITGWDVVLSIVVIGVSTLVYTFLGGIKAVVWTDVLQFGIYLISAAIAMAIILGKVPGGWSTIRAAGEAAGKFRIIDFGTDGLIAPWRGGDWSTYLLGVLKNPYTFWGGVIGATALDTGTHGADQMMVQRYLTARSQRQAAWAVVASGFLILIQFALFLAIGVSLWVLYDHREFPKDAEFATFIKDHMPVGLRGLVIAAIFSVTMSTLSGAISASASSTVNDLIRPVFPSIGDARLLRLSKWLTAVWGVVLMGVAIASIGLQDNVVNNALAIAGFVMGPLLGLFLLGIVTRRVGQWSAFIGLVAGLAATTAVKFSGVVAYPWFAVVGSGVVFLVAIAVCPLIDRDRSADAERL